MAILTCNACGAKNRLPEVMPGRGPRCGRCKQSLAPQLLTMSTVDIGAIRYFDGRGIPRDAWLGDGPFQAAIGGEAGRETPNAYVWVLPGEASSLLDEIPDEPAVVWLGGVRGPLLGPRLEGTVLLCVDREGWRPKASIEAIARAVGVQIVLGLPALIEAGTTRTTRELLDRARANPQRE